ncbi:hypothetical protein AK88_04806 [Plasmodium fragile]|uniref:Pv-fam-d protein n=1 Tax=Plasmodium fragile TaxID=5857 RepID=A0A0D9QEQ9_PLAFR|nr:uncharacterized protein AK88_04806 [Plasmodium fragile]KJP85540.1 hypothetical protein AK88_04806 [Plasmodium fragile]
MKNLYCPSLIQWFICFLLLLLWNEFTYTNENTLGELWNSKISRKNGSFVHYFRLLVEEDNTDMCNSYSTLLDSVLHIMSDEKGNVGKAVKISLDNDDPMDDFNNVETDEKFPTQVSSYTKGAKHKHNSDASNKDAKYASNVYNSKRKNDSYLDDYYDEYEKYEKEKYNHKYYDGRKQRHDERGNYKYRPHHRYHEDRDDHRYPQERDMYTYQDDYDNWKYGDDCDNYKYLEDARYAKDRDEYKYRDDARYAKDRDEYKYRDDARCAKDRDHRRYAQQRDDRRYAHDQRGHKNKKYRDEYNKYDEYYKYDGKDYRDYQDDSYRKPSNYKQPAFDNEANKLPRKYPAQDSPPKPLNATCANVNKAGNTHDPMNLGDNAKKLHTTIKNNSDNSKGYYSKRYYGDRGYDDNYYTRQNDGGRYGPSNYDDPYNKAPRCPQYGLQPAQPLNSVHNEDSRYNQCNPMLADHMYKPYNLHSVHNLQNLYNPMLAYHLHNLYNPMLAYHLHNLYNPMLAYHLHNLYNPINSGEKPGLMTRILDTITITSPIIVMIVIFIILAVHSQTVGMSILAALIVTTSAYFYHKYRKCKRMFKHYGKTNDPKKFLESATPPQITLQPEPPKNNVVNYTH